jgi:hypothetical protein
MRKEMIIKSIAMKIIFIIFQFPFQSFAQDISGVWVGYIYNDTTHQNIHYELAINEPDGKSGGYSHTTFVFDSVKNIGVKSVKIKIKNDHIYVNDDKFIYNNYSVPPPEGVKMYSYLVFSKNDTADVLSGMWRTNATKVYNPITGTIFLERKRKEKPQETIIVAKLIDLGLRDKLLFLKPEISVDNTVAVNDRSSTSAKHKPSELTASTKENEEIKKEEQASKEKLAVSPNDTNKNLVIISKDEKDNGINTNKQIKAGKKEENISPSTVALNERAKKERPTAKEESTVVSNEKNYRGQKKVEEKNNKPGNEINVEEPEKNTTDVVSDDKRKRKNDVVKDVEPIKNEEPVTASNIKDKQVDNLKEVPRKESKTKPETVFKAPLQVNPPAAEISKRKIETIRTVEISQDSVVLSLYDNGTVDGDTVSVLLNGEVIMPRVGLLAKAINKTVYLTPEMGDSISVIMYAENLGSIPPNTGLLVIREAKRIFEIRFSGDLNKNSKIILIRKKND